MNLMAVEDLEADFEPLDVVLIESGGDNLTATFSPGLVDAQIFVLDVAGGGDVARKGGPGIARADLLVINKTDLGPYVEVDVAQMVADATAARSGAPVLALSRRDPDSVDRLCGWVRSMLHEHRHGRHTPVDPGPMAPHSHASGAPDELAHGWPLTVSARRTGRRPGTACWTGGGDSTREPSGERDEPRSAPTRGESGGFGGSGGLRRSPRPGAVMHRSCCPSGTPACHWCATTLIGL